MTNATQHTQGPWATNTAIHPADQVFSGDVIVADCKWTDHTPEQRERNAARIVACVNACAGYDTDDLTGRDLRAESQDEISIHDELLTERNQLRDSLRAALAMCDAVTAERDALRKQIIDLSAQCDSWTEKFANEVRTNGHSLTNAEIRAALAGGGK